MSANSNRRSDEGGSRRYEAYRQFSEQLITATTAERVAELVVGNVCALLGAEASALMTVEPLAGSQEQNWLNLPSAGPWNTMPKAVQRCIMEFALDQCQPIAVADAQAFLSKLNLPPAPEIHNFIAFPLCSGPICRGVVAACNLRSEVESSENLREGLSIARLAAHALDRVSLAALRDRESRMFEAILERTNSHVAYLDCNFNFVVVNSTYERGCGHTREELIGRNHFEFFPNEENEETFTRVRDTGIPAEFREKPFEYPDQPDRGVTYWDWVLTPVKDERGVVEGLVLSLTDVTDSVCARNRVLSEERNRTRLAETLAIEVNHRMKNNLMMVAGMLSRQIREMTVSRDCASLLGTALARLRSIAAVHAQLYEARTDKVELLDACRRIAHESCEAFSAGDIDVAVDGKEVWYASNIATSLCIVSNELMTNAIKHGGVDADGRRRIRIEVIPESELLRLRIWNSGNPVPRDFDVSRCQTLGLQLAREIAVGQFGGALHLHPEDSGTTAEVILSGESLGEVAANPTRGM